MYMTVYGHARSSSKTTSTISYFDMGPGDDYAAYEECTSRTNVTNCQEKWNWASYDLETALSYGAAMG